MATEKFTAHPAHPSTEEQDHPTPAWMAGCSLAALSSRSTTWMARSLSTSACPAAAATRRVGNRAGVSCGVSRPLIVGRRFRWQDR
jgi:alkanesulfonate monooxygenase SsuD/methylene tetrahydromethanopterin reductase-like flavin-dependent oxidoreductase (luciferase family)